LGVTQENPQAYVQQYGAQLLDAQTLIQQARAAGVVEDIVSKIRVQLALSMIFLFSHHPLVPLQSVLVHHHSAKKHPTVLVVHQELN
jgi:hypothetical protein